MYIDFAVNMGKMDTVMAVPILFTYVLIWLKATSAAPSVNISAPMNAVREGTVFDIHCVVSELDTTNYTVRISRQLTDDEGTIQTLYLGPKLETHYIDYYLKDRGIIKPRLLPDGNTFYSLTILRVQMEDQGTYTCSVISQKTMHVISSMSTFVRVVHELPDPQCFSSTFIEDSTDWIEHGGVYLSLTCTAQIGKYPVSISWKRKGEPELRQSDVVTQNIDSHNWLTSNLVIENGIKDNGTIFSCQIKSSVPEFRARTCQVGPIVINSKKATAASTTIADIPYLRNDLHNNGDPVLHNNGEPDEYSISLFSIPTWVLVIADSICVVLIIVTTIGIIVYGVRLSKGKQSSDHFLPSINRRRNDIQVRFERTAEPNIYEAL